MSVPSAEELDALEAQVQLAFAGGGDLEVLGYGEVSSVVALDASTGRFAAKRLPPFPDADSAARYRTCFHKYLEQLENRGVVPVESRLVQASRDRIYYCLQPRLAPESLAVSALRQQPISRGTEVLAAIVERVKATCGPSLGLDAQLSNWVVDGDELRYLDVTTPLMRNADGSEELDVELFVTSLPWLIRGAVRRFLLRGILATYYDARQATVDLFANLLKERLDELFAAAIDSLGSDFAPAITADEARRYYRSDARTWALLQRLRRVDRAWQRGVRRRTYPFLLPGKIER